MEQHEEWRPVVGYPDYEVSNHGRVASVRKGVRRELRGGYTGAGYRKVALCSGGHRIGRKVHHLVADAFLGPRPTGMHIRHLDDVKTNNAVWNLATGTKSDNAHDAVRNGVHSNAAKTHCPSGHPYDEDNTYVQPNGGRNCRTCARERDRTRALRAANVSTERAA